MPGVRTNDKVLAILCSDLHLSHTPPLARSNETSWYGCMRESLFNLRQLSVTTSAPVVCAGDIFDKWNAPAELINFAIEQLPNMYAVPGQHDLPYHALGDIKKSAYWTLVEAKKIVDITPGFPMTVNGVTLHGFPWGTKITDCCVPKKKGMKQLAVIHAYCWMKDCGYPDAPEEGKVSSWRSDLQTYDAAVFGDNHKGFLSQKNSPPILNCGSFMRRKADEKNYHPKIGLLHASGQITVVSNEPEKEVWLDIPDALTEDPMRLAKLAEELHDLYRDGILNFLEAIDHFTNDKQVRQEVKKLVLKSAREI